MAITLKTLHQATAQEVFDQVVNHLRTQGQKSQLKKKNGLFFCAYRGEGGLKCAAGCLISDDEYCSDMEGKDWFDSSLFPTPHQQLIFGLQLLHDGASVSNWESQFHAVAEKHNLNYTPIEA